jgi:hypothetical protein
VPAVVLDNASFARVDGALSPAATVGALRGEVMATASFLRINGVDVIPLVEATSEARPCRAGRFAITRDGEREH